MNDDDLDKNATAEMFMLVAGVSTIMFGLSTDLPFLVAPSVLYAARETGYMRAVAEKIERGVRKKNEEGLPRSFSGSVEVSFGIQLNIP